MKSTYEESWIWAATTEEEKKPYVLCATRKRARIVANRFKKDGLKSKVGKVLIHDFTYSP